jgi:hypothetical protein
VTFYHQYYSIEHYKKLIKSIKMVPGGKKIGKEQLNIFAYADGKELSHSEHANGIN